MRISDNHLTKWNLGHMTLIDHLTKDKLCLVLFLATCLIFLRFSAARSLPRSEGGAWAWLAPSVSCNSPALTFLFLFLA